MSDTKLFYIHDPMCSWCYAFSSSLTDLQRALAPDIPVFYVVGGLAPDTTVPMPVEMQNALQQVWRRIEQTVPSIRFNFDFWVLNKPIRSTYPACRAMLAASKQGADFEIAMLQAIQTAYYQRAKNPSLPATLLECALEAGLDDAEFAKDFSSPALEAELQNEIQYARSMGVSAYPSLRLLHCEELSTIAVDYFDSGKMIEQINRIVSK